MKVFILFIIIGLALVAFLLFNGTKHLTLQWCLGGLYLISGVVLTLLIATNIIKFQKIS